MKIIGQGLFQGKKQFGILKFLWEKENFKDEGSENPNVVVCVQYEIVQSTVQLIKIVIAIDSLRNVYYIW